MGGPIFHKDHFSPVNVKDLKASKIKACQNKHKKGNNTAKNRKMISKVIF